MLKLTKIEKKHLILCEGPDAVGFLNEYLYRQVEQYSAIQVTDFGGNQEFRKSLALLRNTDGFSNLCSLLVIRDVETNFQSALDQIRDALRENSFTVSNVQGEWEEGTPSTCFLLFPGLGRNASNGALEDLCMSILKEHDATKVTGRIDTFLDTLKRDGLRNFTHLHKTRLHTYFSITNDFIKKCWTCCKSTRFRLVSPQSGTFKNLHQQNGDRITSCKKN